MRDDNAHRGAGAHALQRGYKAPRMDGRSRCWRCAHPAEGTVLSRSDDIRPDQDLRIRTIANDHLTAATVRVRQICPGHGVSSGYRRNRGYRTLRRVRPQ
ncbi:hypothetical protein MABM_39080 [Mycobacteroides abscessus]|nr:hypothetical protein MABM_39080 [Mycobacteroides abscessus]